MEIAICDDDELFNEIMSEKLSTVLNKSQIKYNITPFFNGSELITALNDPLKTSSKMGVRRNTTSVLGLKCCLSSTR